MKYLSKIFAKLFCHLILPLLWRFHNSSSFSFFHIHVPDYSHVGGEHLYGRNLTILRTIKWRDVHHPNLSLSLFSFFLSSNHFLVEEKFASLQRSVHNFVRPIFRLTSLCTIKSKISKEKDFPRNTFCIQLQSNTYLF